ncbi:RidA family protein [Kibdelosporangium lantanae]
MPNVARTENFGLPWESGYGDVQARQHGDTIYISGQVANNRRTTDGANMADQMRQAYANIGELLTRFGATFDNVVEEVLYVTDFEAAFEAAGPVRRAAYGRDDPQVTSTLIGVTRVALPGHLIEIKVVARV